MIVGTAGHIDHGKTTLVRTLTCVDTDRLKEEKARGISIELGYAYTPLANGDVLGFVDVPGHERFIHTMVAGASGIDVALLVVAADDGVMPQTREHLAILELLGVTRGVVAITKIDRADGARADAIETSIAALLAATPFAGSPIFRVDARDDACDGMRALRAHVHGLATQSARRASPGLFRLAVDRVFTLAGHGTIATGTVLSGRVDVADVITIMPAGIRARVRSIHAQNRDTRFGTTGQRCAINLANIEKSEIERGDWLADARALLPSTRIDMRWRVLADPAAPTVDGTPLHIHIGTAHRIARVFALTSSDHAPRAQLVFASPICAMPGDRFVARDAQAAHTIGGGVVVDPYAPARKRRSAERMSYLDAIERMLEDGDIGDLIECAPAGLALEQLVRLTGNAGIGRRIPESAVLFGTSNDAFVISSARERALAAHAVAVLRRFHDDVPNDPGVAQSRLHRMVMPNVPAPLAEAMIDAWIARCVLVRNGAWLHLPDHRVSLDDRETKLALELMPRIAAGRFDPPWVRDLASHAAASEDEVRTTLRKLLAQGAVYQVVHDLFYARESIRALAELAASLAAASGQIEAATYRNEIGLGRKRTIQILEFFDRVGYTRRVRNTHRLRGDSGQRMRF